MLASGRGGLVALPRLRFFLHIVLQERYVSFRWEEKMPTLPLYFFFFLAPTSIAWTLRRDPLL